MDKTYLTARQVRRRYGDCSDMCLWRWLQDEELGFPKPTYINRRRYWDAAELDQFDRAHPEKKSESRQPHQREAA